MIATRNTTVLKVNASRPRIGPLKSAAQVLRKGGLVAFPTETVYGLGANALDASAVKKVYHVKARPFDDPIIVHICEASQLYTLARKVPPEAKALAARFWPGPLTMVLKKSALVPKITTGGLDTVAIRMPSSKVALALIRKAGFPIAAPSANLFGKPSPTLARHVKHDLSGKIDVIIDGGRAKIGVESTVIDLSGKKPVLLRPGAVTLKQLEKILGKVKVHPLVLENTGGAHGNSKRKHARAPGMSYRHYAPKAEVILVEGSPKNVKREVNKLALESGAKKTMVLRTTGIGNKKIAASLFETFRKADRKGIKLVIVEAVEEKGLGMAIMNRLKKAASSVVRARDG